MAFNAIETDPAKMKSPVTSVLMNLLQIATGLAVGIMVGFLMKPINKIAHLPWVKYLKLGICMFMAILLPIATELTNFHEAKYIGIIFFGYFCHRFWKEEKPEEELAWIWAFMQPFLFGSVGASVLFNRVKAN